MSAFYRALLLSALGIIFSFSAFSQSIARPVKMGEEDWRFLEQAKTLYRQGDYGGAIAVAERARSSRIQRCQWETYTLERTLRLSSVRRAGDKIDDVLPVLEQNGLTDPVNIVKIHLNVRGADFYHNSVSKILEFEQHLKEYPEVDYLIGKVYRMEGEYDLALQYMKSAYSAIDILNVPAEKYDILYELADLCYDTGREDDFEKYLLLVLSDNADYTNERYMNALIHIIEENEKTTVEKFFMLYRSTYSVTLESLIRLSTYYMNLGENDKALKCASLGTITALTKIEAALEDRIYDYDYTGLKDLLTRSSQFTDIVEWGNSHGVWELFVHFADIAMDSGNLVFAHELYKTLEKYAPDTYWQNMASSRLVK